MNRRRQFVTAALALALVTVAACGGPVTPIDVASRELPLDLLLGRRARTVAEAPVPPFVIPRSAFASGGGLARPEMPSVPDQTTPPPEPSSCPKRDLLAVPRLVARNVIDRPPVPATYPYRMSGKLTDGAISLLFGPTATVTIANIQRESSGFTFDVRVDPSAATSMSTYRVVSEGLDPGRTTVTSVPRIPSTVPNPATLTPGLYLASTENFSPPYPGLAIVHFPIQPGRFLDATATDGPTTRTHRAQVGAKEVFDACGEPIDTFVVTMRGTVVQGGLASEAATFEETVWIGPQYGGVFLAHRALVVAGNLSRSVELKASREPQEAR